MCNSCNGHIHSHGVLIATNYRLSFSLNMYIPVESIIYVSQHIQWDPYKADTLQKSVLIIRVSTLWGLCI